MTPVPPVRWVPPLVAGFVLVGLACVLGAVIHEVGNGPFLVDAQWNDILEALVSPVLLAFSWAMNVLGGGWFATFVVPIGVTVALLIARRPWAGAYFLLASALSAAAVQVLKHLFGRARPEDIVVVSDFGSFPSGHTANAATLAVALFVLFPRLWVGIAGIAWVLMMAFSRTYLHAHWLSDTIGGGFAGAGAALIAAGALAIPVAHEAARRAVHRAVARDDAAASDPAVAGAVRSDGPAAGVDTPPTTAGDAPRIRRAPPG